MHARYQYKKSDYPFTKHPKLTSLMVIGQVTMFAFAVPGCLHMNQSMWLMGYVEAAIFTLAFTILRHVFNTPDSKTPAENEIESDSETLRKNSLGYRMTNWSGIVAEITGLVCMTTGYCTLERGGSVATSHILGAIGATLLAIGMILRIAELYFDKKTADELEHIPPTALPPLELTERS